MKDLFAIMPDFLRDPEAFFESIHRDENVREKAARLAWVALFSFMAFGLVLGLEKSWQQALSSALKVPFLFLSTMLFCLPALYFFSLALLRTPLKMRQVLTVVLAGISVSGFLLLGLAPITLFFVLTSDNYEFFQLLAVAFVGISASIGVSFLWRGMTLVEASGEPGAQALGRRILFLWILLYGFVGTQMTWRLSPFIGKPEDPFFWIKPSRDNFYVDVAHAILGFLQVPASEAGWVMPLVLSTSFVMLLMLILIAGGMSGRRRQRQSPSGASASAAPGAVR